MLGLGVADEGAVRQLGDLRLGIGEIAVALVLEDLAVALCVLGREHANRRAGTLCEDRGYG